MRGVTLFWACVVLLVVSTSDALAGRRLALVVGNGAYLAAPVKTTRADAADIAEALRELGFDVDLRLDVSSLDLKACIMTFGTKLKDSEVGVFYYAGHAAQMGGDNYLLPVDVKTGHNSRVLNGGVRLSDILRLMGTAGNLGNLLILDASRPHPYVMGLGAGGAGLARLDAPRGTMLAYSTTPGRTTEDKDLNERNSVYTKALLTHLREGDIKVEELLRRVRADVLSATGNRQMPSEVSGLTSDLSFTHQPATAARTSSSQQAAPAQGDKAPRYLWDIIKGWFPKETSGEAPKSDQASAASRNGAQTLSGEELLTLGRIAYKAQNYPEAAARFDAAAQLGSGEGQYFRASMYAAGEGGPPDYAEALRLARLAAEQGEIRAYLLLGELTSEGKGISQDLPEAFRWFEKAAARGDAAGEYRLGYSYLTGQGVLPHDRVAFGFFKRAAEKGEVRAQFCLGWMYENGRGAVRNLASAVRWYKQAGCGGEAKALINLGLMHLRGEGVTRSDTMAFAHMMWASEIGSAFAQRRLAEMYMNGEGTNVDRTQALVWAMLAAMQNEPRAVELRDQLVEKLSAQQRNKAQTAASQWRPKDWADLPLCAESAGGDVPSAKPAGKKGKRAKR